MSLDFEKEEEERKMFQAYSEEIFRTLSNEDVRLRRYYVKKLESISHEDMMKRLEELIQEQEEHPQLVFLTSDFPCDDHFANIFLMRYIATCRELYGVYFNRQLCVEGTMFTLSKTNTKKHAELTFGPGVRLLNPAL